MENSNLTFEVAVSLLPAGDYVHTFINNAFGLIGADWSREEIIDKLRKSEIIQLTGSMARKLNHGMCAYNKDTKRQDEILFIETDCTKLEALDPEANNET